MSHSKSLAIILPCLLSLSAAACIERSVTGVTPVPSKEERTEFPVSQNRNLDILFVIDNSGSMLAEQESLAINFGRIAEALEGLEGGLPNVHIGVVSTNMGGGASRRCIVGDQGLLQAQPRVSGCSVPSDPYISNIDGVPNYSGTLSDAFSCIAQLGDQGCGFEQPLESMRKALDGSNLENSGFLRKEALLAVVFITDEDDCSTADPGMFANVGEPGEDLGPLKSFRCFEHGVTCDDGVDPRSPGVRGACVPKDDSEYMHDVAGYVNFLKGLKNFESDILVAGIVGKAGPVEVTTDAEGNPCLMYSCGDVAVCAGAKNQPAAVPPVRLRAFIDAFARNTTTTICDGDLSRAVQKIADFFGALDGVCIENALRDIDPDRDGLQAECSVSELRRPNTAQQTETILPLCDDAQTELPCYRLLEDTERCVGTPQNLRVDVVYADDATVPSDTRIRAACLGD